MCIKRTKLLRHWTAEWALKIHSTFLRSRENVQPPVFWLVSKNHVRNDAWYRLVFQILSETLPEDHTLYWRPLWKCQAHHTQFTFDSLFFSSLANKPTVLLLVWGLKTAFHLAWRNWTHSLLFSVTFCLEILVTSAHSIQWSFITRMDVVELQQATSSTQPHPKSPCFRNAYENWIPESWLWVQNFMLKMPPLSKVQMLDLRSVCLSEWLMLCISLHKPTNSYLYCAYSNYTHKYWGILPMWICTFMCMHLHTYKQNNRNTHFDALQVLSIVCLKSFSGSQQVW